MVASTAGETIDNRRKVSIIQQQETFIQEEEREKMERDRERLEKEIKVIVLCYWLITLNSFD